MRLKIPYLIYMYKMDLALNDQQWLTCHKTKPNQTRRKNYEFKQHLYALKYWLCVASFTSEGNMK